MSYQIIRFLSLTAVVSALLGCGQMGPLALPSEQPQPTDTETR